MYVNALKGVSSETKATQVTGEGAVVNGRGLALALLILGYGSAPVGVGRSLH